MENLSQEEAMEAIMKRPLPQKRVGVVRLQMVKESRTLYGMRSFSGPEAAVQAVLPLFDMADREMVAVLSLNAKLEPVAFEIIAVGGLTACFLDIKNIFKHALLANAASVICFHNHTSGHAEPSNDDRLLTKRVCEAGMLLGLPMIDHIILGDGCYFSFREEGLIPADSGAAYGQK